MQPGAARERATDTLADTAVLESSSLFYRDAVAAAKYAFDASRIQNVADSGNWPRSFKWPATGANRPTSIITE
jgi:hypothetical protein